MVATEEGGGAADDTRNWQSERRDRSNAKAKARKEKKH
jgi:hypothetical protein